MLIIRQAAGLFALKDCCYAVGLLSSFSELVLNLSDNLASKGVNCSRMLLLVFCQASNIILHSTHCCLHVFLRFFGSFSCAPGFCVALCEVSKHLTFKIFLRNFFELSGLSFDTRPDYLHDCNWVLSSSPLSVGQL